MSIMQVSCSIAPKTILNMPQQPIINSTTNIATESKTTIDVYDQLIDLKHFRFVIALVTEQDRNGNNRQEPSPEAIRTLNMQRTCCKEMYNKCQDKLLFLIMLVMSAIENFNYRYIIRKTWGRERKCIKVFYLLGMNNDKKFTKKIYQENLKYRDIIQGNFLDSYRNLTYKHVMALKWATHFCKEAKYIVKTDDDIVVNTDLLFEKLKGGYWSATDLIACKVNHHSSVHRKGTNGTYYPNFKWFITKEEYPDNKYPDFCQGAFTIYSADVVRRLLQASRKIPYFWLEDVHVTGTLAKKIGVKHQDLSDWFLVETDDLFLLGPNKTKPFVYGPIELYPVDIIVVWRALKGLRGVRKIIGKTGRKRKIKAQAIKTKHGLTSYLQLLPSGKTFLRN